MTRHFKTENLIFLLPKYYKITQNIHNIHIYIILYTDPSLL